MKDEVFNRIKDLHVAWIRRMAQLKSQTACHAQPKAPNPTQLKIFSYLMEHRDQPVLQRDLEKALNLRRATISAVLKKMEANGYIERQVADQDARSKQIRLTDLALDRYQTGLDHVRDLELQMVQGISEEDLAIFIQVMKQMVANIEVMEEGEHD